MTRPNDPREEHDETADASFADILKEFENASRAEREKAVGRGSRKGKKKAGGPPLLRGTVVGVSGDFVLIDYGGKSEGVIAAADLLDSEGKLGVQRGEVLNVTITGFNNEGM